MECERYQDQMLDVLYGEADAETARQVEAHQAACEACREEMGAFRRLRRDLRAWTLPEAPLARRPVPASHAPRTWLAMAAGLVLAAGAALGLSGSEVGYQDGRLTFRLGRGPATSDVTARLAAQEARLLREIEALKGALGAAQAAAPAPAAAAQDPAGAMARVARLIRESESRQAVILNASLSELEERSRAQRRQDIERTIAMASYLDTKASVSALRTTALMAQVVPVSQQR